MKWKLLFALGGAVGGIAYAAYLRNRRDLEDAALWAEATDPVVRFGD